MGNAASGLPYEVGEAIEPYSGNIHWTMHQGTRKDDTKEEKDRVTIFRFLKTQADKLTAAQRNWQKLRTLRHPYVLSFIDGVELEDSVMVVTEDVVPLEVWIKQQSEVINADSTADQIETVTQEIVWGFKCITDALSFLHNNCNVVHGYTGLHAVFLSKNGDWKLGAMDLACNIHDDADFFRGNEHLLGKPFRSPERTGEKWVSAFPKGASATNAAGALDVFSLAHVISQCFSSVRVPVPEDVESLLKTMMKVAPKARPTCTQLQSSPVFASEYISIMGSLGELALKPAAECIEILGKLASRAGGIPKAVVTHKILPNVGRSLSTASTDFQNRDLREAARNTVQSALQLLAQLAEQSKIEETPFQNKVVPAVSALWNISDRAVRTSLLKTLKPLVPLLSTEVVNKRIFEPLLAGFADSNYKMREESLKSLIPLVDRLQEKQLQDQLVRCVCNLQADPEAAIRTNATIFIGKIAPKLTPAVRTKTLVTAFGKAMKDAFVPCRVSGLKAALACLAADCFEPQQVAHKLMPQVCMLLLDGVPEIRELSLTCMKECMQVMEGQHRVLSQAEERERERDRLKDRDGGRDLPSASTAPPVHAPVDSPSPAVGGGGGGGGGGGVPSVGQPTAAGNAGVFGAWSSLSFSWAVDGLAKSLTTPDASSAGAGAGAGGSSGEQAKVAASSGPSGDWDRDVDDLPARRPGEPKKASTSSSSTSSSSSSSGGASTSVGTGVGTGTGAGSGSVQEEAGLDVRAREREERRRAAAARTAAARANKAATAGESPPATSTKSSSAAAPAPVSSKASASSASVSVSSASAAQSTAKSKVGSTSTSASASRPSKAAAGDWDMDLDALDVELDGLDMDLEAEIAAMSLDGLDLDLDPSPAKKPADRPKKPPASSAAVAAASASSGNKAVSSSAAAGDGGARARAKTATPLPVDKDEDEDGFFDDPPAPAPAPAPTPAPRAPTRPAARATSAAEPTAKIQPRAAATAASADGDKKKAGAGAGAAVKKVAVTKLAVQSGEWDDF